MVSGEPTAEKAVFGKVALAVLAGVGLARLGLSLSGVPDGVVRWLSTNAVGWLAAFAYGALARRGPGGYRRLLPFAFSQALVFHSIAVLGILLTIAGLPNIYGAPEYGGPASQRWLHLASHLVLGMPAATLLWWGASCLSLLVGRWLDRR